MNILTIEAEIWWIGLSDEIRPERGINTREMIQRVATELQFFVVPTAVPAEGGMVFERGSLGSINIARLTVYSDGLSVSVPGPTDDAETVMAHCLELFHSLGVRRPITPPLHYPVSRLIADFDYSIDSLLRPSSALDLISKNLVIPAKAHLLNFVIAADPLTLPKRAAGINPTLFRIERRDGIEYEKNRYFSTANVPTSAHRAILEQLERDALSAK